MNKQFEVQLRPCELGYILDIYGEITKLVETDILTLIAWEQGLGDQKQYLVLNLVNVPYINSAGIAILIRLVRSGKKGQYHTFAFGVSSHYQKLFQMVGLTEHMMIYPDEYAVMQRIEELSKIT